MWNLRILGKAVGGVDVFCRGRQDLYLCRGMVRPRLKVADRDEISMAYNFVTKNRKKKKKRNDRTLVLAMKFSSIIAEF